MHSGYQHQLPNHSYSVSQRQAPTHPAHHQQSHNSLHPIPPPPSFSTSHISFRPPQSSPAPTGPAPHQLGGLHQQEPFTAHESLYHHHALHSAQPSSPQVDAKVSNGSNSFASSSSSPSRSTSVTATTTPQTEADQSGKVKAVVRAACLACRTAKRRCDGIQPVCGPCSLRGVTQDSGACAYVASKRGGPRFKGCTGEQAKKIKAEKERSRGQSGRRKPRPNMEERSNGTAAAAKQSPSDSGYSGEADRDSLRRDTGSHSGGRTSEHLPTSSSSTSASQAVSSPSVLSGMTGSYLMTTPEEQRRPHLPSRDSQHPGQPQFSSSLLKPTDTYSDQHAIIDQRSALSAANLAIWQRHQDSRVINDEVDSSGYNPDSLLANEDFSFDDFYSRLESLPKAGQVGSASSDTAGVPDWDTVTNDILDAADSEQQARFLLTYFFEKVYSSAPVLLGPENLSSLAFWFSGKGPCALYAAIGALVTLRLPDSEAHRTLRGGYASQHSANSNMTRIEVAAQHARTSEFLLKRFSEQQAAAAAATFGLDPSSVIDDCNGDISGRSLCQGASDSELLRVEAAAAHTLLAHYHYGAGGHTAQAVAHKHALEAWTSLQGVRFDLKEGMAPRDPLSTSHFSWDQKQEWAKRVYWTSFAATSVTACTGGFSPVRDVCDSVTALKLRPALESDVGAWGVFIRGAQHVARGYSAIHSFELLKQRKDLPDDDVAREKALIFSEYSKLDRDMSAFTTYDPAWRSLPEDCAGSDLSEHGLGFALRTAGKLMTAGATIIVHRGQAYSNANIFLEPQCGLPQASRTSVEQQTKSAKEALFGIRSGAQTSSAMNVDDDRRSPSPSEQYTTPDRLWHRSGSVTLPPAGSGSRGSGSEGSTTCKSGAFDRQVAALDANFVHYNSNSNGNWMAGSGQVSEHQQPHPPSYNHSHPGYAATDTAMAAFHRFQAQQHSDSRPDGSTFSVGDGTHHLVPSSPPPIPAFVTERYKFGPFEPEHSMAKCRWAAAAMLSSVGPLLPSCKSPREPARNILGNILTEAPSLPPWAACSYVLAGYCLLMQCLIVQASRAWRYSSQITTPEALSNAGSGDDLDAELRELRTQVLAIHDLLARFALTFNIAKEYKKEVAVLLEVNRRLR